MFMYDDRIFSKLFYYLFDLYAFEMWCDSPTWLLHRHLNSEVRNENGKKRDI